LPTQVWISAFSLMIVSGPGSVFAGLTFVAYLSGHGSMINGNALS
jgi:hypothetical protein